MHYNSHQAQLRKIQKNRLHTVIKDFADIYYLKQLIMQIWKNVNIFRLHSFIKHLQKNITKQKFYIKMLQSICHCFPLYSFGWKKLLWRVLINLNNSFAFHMSRKHTLVSEWSKDDVVISRRAALVLEFLRSRNLLHIREEVEIETSSLLLESTQLYLQQTTITIYTFILILRTSDFWGIRSRFVSVA